MAYDGHFRSLSMYFDLLTKNGFLISNSTVCSVLHIINLLLSPTSTAKQTFEPGFPGEPIVQKNPVEKPFSIEFPRPDNPSRFTEQPYVSIQSPSQSATIILIYQVNLIFFRAWNLQTIRSKIWT